MLAQVVKVALTSLLVVAASEAAKRSIVVGAILASLPLTSLLAMVWLYADTRDPEKVAALATGIFWLILPSLTLLLVLPLLLRRGVPFVPSLLIGIALTVASYYAMITVLGWLGIEL
jgi:F0F1-type ATP synthase assembly protein I